MKNISKILALSLSLCASIFAASAANAQMQGGFHHNQQQMQMRGGFQGPNSAQLVSVSQLKNLPDESYAVVEGNIVRQIRGDHYEFRDASGSVQVEIDHKYWGANNVTPQNKVRLLIEVDHDLMSSEYDVKAPVVVLN